MDLRSLQADENGRLDGGRSCIARSSQPSGAGAQMQFRHAESQIEPNRGGHRDRLQRDRVVGTADENVGAEAGGDRHLAARAEIIAARKAGPGGAMLSVNTAHTITPPPVAPTSSPNLLIDPL